jgi:hypothetical protein
MRHVPVPSIQDLADVYAILLHRFEDACHGEKIHDQVALWSRWSRVDARLFEIWISAIAKDFNRLNPFLLWKANLQLPEPAVLAVHLEFVRERLERTDASFERIEEFRAWREGILYGVKKSPYQMFFISDGRPRPQKALVEISKSLKAFTAWGFFGSESPVSLKAQRSPQSSKTELTRAQREQILADLAKKKKTITVEMYLAAADHRIHRRTAERDLARSALLKPKGFTRSREYQVDRR